MMNNVTNESTNVFNRNWLTLNAQLETERIVNALEDVVHHTLRKQGAVVGISGGIDSSVVLALCARAFGPDKVVGILLPEKESSPESADLARELADVFGVKPVTEDITDALEGFGCYRRRNEAISRMIPQYQPGWNVKIVLPGDLLDQGTLNIFQLVATDPNGTEYRQRLPLREYYQIVAASNFKQRTRTNMLYYYAELHNYSVIGTPNKNEHDLGFFVKFGDGGYDFAPIRHLFKTQVYQLAEYLGVPQSICSRPPTTDTYPGGGSQEEFFYRIPFDLLDCIWLGHEQDVSQQEIADGLGLHPDQVKRVLDDIIRKQHTTEILRTAPMGIS